MTLYLLDLDDTLVQTLGHVTNRLYPAVAKKLGIEPPSAEMIRSTWGKSLQYTLTQLFDSRSYDEVFLLLREAHISDPTPPFNGVSEYLEQVLKSSHNRVVVFSGGHPDIVHSTVNQSLRINRDRLIVYGLPAGRRLRPVDLDILSEQIDSYESTGRIVVASDTPADYDGIAGEPRAVFLGVTSGVATKADHEDHGVKSEHIFQTLDDAFRFVERSDILAADSDQCLPPTLVSAIKDRRCTIFLGAGVSVDSGLPTAMKLAESLDNGGQSLTDILTGLHSTPEIYAKLYRIFAGSRLVPNPIHRALALLDAPYYVGTNWDHLLERAFRELYGASCDSHFGVAFRDEHLPAVVGRRNVYIKLHGDIERRDSLVADVKSYADRIAKPSLIDKYVEILLNTSVLLFVGYSIQDINVFAQLMAHRDWEGAAPPERFALLSGVDESNRKRLQKAGVTVIDVTTNYEGTIGQQTLQTLTMLYDARADFATDARLLPGIHRNDPEELFARAFVYYRESKFSRCLEVADKIRTSVKNWRENPTLLARYCYIVVKSHDKIEQWEKIEQIHELYFSQQFAVIKPVMPGAMFDWMDGHYRSALALAALRAGFPTDAMEHIEMSISAARRMRGNARLLLADRRTIRAMVLQYLIKMGKQVDTLSAWDDLRYVQVALKHHGNLGMADEVHFAGRFYGAAVFLELTQGVSHEAGIFHGQNKLADFAHASHRSGIRVPYGVVAGRYCEAYFRWRESQASRTGIRTELEGVHQLLSLDHLDSDFAIGSCTEAKVRLLSDVIAGADFELAAKAAAKGSVYAAKHIAQLGAEGWIGTPIN